MKYLQLAIKILLLLLGGFFILMAFDVFGTVNGSTWELIGGFLISISPGVVCILLVILLWKKTTILGLLMIALGIGLFFLFKFYIETSEKWLTILTVEIPLIIGGIILMLKLKEQSIKS